MVSDTKLNEPALGPREALIVHEVTTDQARPGRTALLRRISWGAVIGGTIGAIACQLVFSTLGAAIGLAAVEPAAGDTAGRGMAIGAGVWWMITGLVSLLIGGLVAGRLAGFPHPVDATLHGLLVWAASAVVGAVLVTSSTAGLMGGAMGPLNDAIRSSNARYGDRGTTGDRVASGLATIGNAAIDQADRASRGTTPPDSPGIDRDRRPVPDRTDRAVHDPDPARSAPAGTHPGVRRVAPETAGVDKSALTSAALWTFFALVLGCGAASLGGLLARPPAVVGADPALV